MKLLYLLQRTRWSHKLAGDELETAKSVQERANNHLEFLRRQIENIELTSVQQQLFDRQRDGLLRGIQRMTEGTYHWWGPIQRFDLRLRKLIVKMGLSNLRTTVNDILVSAGQSRVAVECIAIF